MGRISLVSYEQADDKVRKVMDDHTARGYRITNMKKTLLHSVTSFRSLEDGFYDLQEALVEFLGQQAVEIFGYAISSNDDCIVCSAYFQKILTDRGIDFETFAFTETESLLIEFAKAMVNQKGHVPSEVLDELQKHFNEQQMVEITSFAAMLVANNFFNNALQVESELLPDSSGNIK